MTLHVLQNFTKQIFKSHGRNVFSELIFWFLKLHSPFLHNFGKLAEVSMENTLQ